MGNFSRLEVVAIMKSTGLVPLFYHPEVDVGKSVIKACYDGGARLLEFTARGDFAFEVFSELIKYSNKELPGMVMGVGSITDLAAASLYMQMGANFIVTPSFREDIAIACNRRKVLWSPGCGSLTEINRAEELGCEIIKLFPGETYGPSFVKAIRGPQPWTNIMPTGGVSTDEANLRNWFNSGVTCVGMGSKLISKELLKKNDYHSLKERVAQTIGTIQSIRSKG